MMIRPAVLPRGQRVEQDMHSPQYQMVSLFRSASISASSFRWTVSTILRGSYL